MTNKKEYKILRKALSLTLAMLVSILGLPLAKPQQVSATETSDPKYLSSITMDATASSSWETNYDTTLYATLTGSGYDSSYTTEGTALQISTAAQLAAFARAVNVGGKNFSGKYVKLTANIDLKGGTPTVTKTPSGDKFNISVTNPVGQNGEAIPIENVWVPIGNGTTKFMGTFDGDGHEVSNMTVLANSTSSDVYAGLFGYIREGSIKNTGVTGNVFASSSEAAYTGGLVGKNMRGDVSNSYATGNVYVSSSSYEAYAGGLVGYNDGSGSISNSYATGNVYAYSYSSVRAGGLIGYIYGNTTNSYATGDVYASSSNNTVYAGGLAGYSSSITNSYATGNVYASSSSSSVYAGGLVGRNDDSITNSYATGNVYASSSSKYVYGGGLAGYSSSITNSYYYSGATIDVPSGKTPSDYGTGLTMDQMTGTGTGRATEKMTGFDTSNWAFQADSGRIRYLPRLKVITYDETTNPAPRFLSPFTANDFGFKAPDNLTYNGSQKVATVTSKISEISDDKITVKYYNSAGTNLTSAPTNAGTYTVKIDVAEGDNYEAQTDITADHWTFTITKADPTIGSTSTTATYKPGLTLKNVPYPSTAGNTPGSWSWTYPSSSIVAGTYTYSAKYTPTDTTNYNSVAKSITVTVNKATPTIISTSTTATYKPGLTLGSVLPPSISGTATAGSWIWSKSTAPISSAGAHYFEAKFKPTDSNYNEVTKCILVTVSKATLQASDFNFAAPSNLEYSADYKTATITRNSVIKGMGELTVKYFTKVNGELTPLGDSSLPTDVGTYYVGINVGDDINYNSASGLTSDNWKFTITPAGKHTYRLSNDSRVYLVTK